MAIFTSQIAARILKALGPHGPDGVLAFAIFLGVLVSAPTLGLLPCAAFGVGMFILYAVRQVLRERHAERMMHLEIRRKQVAIEDYCAKQQVKLRTAGQASVAPPRPGRRT